MAGMSMGTLVGPLMGGILFDFGGFRLPFIVSIGWSLLVLAAASALRLPAVEYSGSVSKHGGNGLWRPFMAVVVGATLLSALEPTLPIFLEKQLGASMSNTGALFALAALVYGACSPIVGFAADRCESGRLTAAGVVACALTLPFLALAANWIAELIALSAFAAACALLFTPALPEIAATCNSHKASGLAAGYAAFSLAYAMGMAVGPIAGSTLATAFGFAPALMVLSISVALTTPAFLCRRPKLSAMAWDAPMAAFADNRIELSPDLFDQLRRSAPHQPRIMS
jgi:MFS family permease